MCKMFHSSAKLIVNDSDIDKAFGSMHQNVCWKQKIMLGKSRLVKQLWNMVLRFFSVGINIVNSIEKWR